MPGEECRRRGHIDGNERRTRWSRSTARGFGRPPGGQGDAVPARRGPMEEESVGTGDDARYATRQRVLVAPVVSRAANASCAGGGRCGRRVRRRGGVSPGRNSATLVRGQT